MKIGYGVFAPIDISSLKDGIIDFLAVLQIFLLYSGIVSLITFVIYGIDKARAQVRDPAKKKMRIPERVLIGLAYAGGAVGAAIGMFVFHHKIRKTVFRINVPTAVILWAAAAAVLFALRGNTYDLAALL